MQTTQTNAGLRKAAAAVARRDAGRPGGWRADLAGEQAYLTWITGLQRDYAAGEQAVFAAAYERELALLPVLARPFAV